MSNRKKSMPGAMTIVTSNGDKHRFKRSELAHIGKQVRVPPELYLDIESEMLGREVDGGAVALIQELLSSASRRGNWGLHRAAGDSQHMFLAIAVMLRICAANRLCIEPFMEHVLRASMTQGDTLLRMAEYFTSAELLWSDDDEQFVFDEIAAEMHMVSLSTCPVGAG